MRIIILLILLSQNLGLMAQEPEIIVQSGHSGWIEDYAISPDSKFMATASVDNTVKLWSTRGKKEIRNFKGHRNSVTSVTFSHNGKMIASGDADGFVFLWDVVTGKQLDTIQFKTKIIDINFSQDDSRIVASGAYRYLGIREIKSRKNLLHDRMWYQSLKAVFMPGDNNLVVSQGADSSMVFWDIKGDSSQAQYSYPSGPVNDFIITADGQCLIALIGGDTAVRVVNLKTLKKVKRFLTNVTYKPKAMVLAGDSVVYISTNFAKNDSNFIEIKKWNFFDGRCLDSATIYTNSHYNFKLLFSPLTQELIYKHSLSILASANTEPLSAKSVMKHSGTIVNNVIEREPGKFLLIGEDGPVKVLDAVNNSFHILFSSTNLGSIGQLVPLKDSLHAFARFIKGSGIYKINLQTFKGYSVISDSFKIRNFRLSGDQSTIVCYATKVENNLFRRGSALLVKRTDSDSLILRKQFPAVGLINYGISFDGKLLMFQDKYDTITLVNLVDGKETYLTDTSGFRFQQASMFNLLDKNTLFTATTDGYFLQWDIPSGKVVKNIKAHSSHIYDIIYSADSSRFVSFADDTVKIWDAKTTELRQKLVGHESWVTKGGFLNGEKELYTSSGDQTFRIWDLATGKEKANFMMVDTADIITRLPNKYYAATRYATKYLSYRIGTDLYPFEQFDLQYNRPHEVLKRLGSKDTARLDLYYKAYNKRLKRAGFKEADFNNDIHLPDVSVVNEDKIPAISKVSQMQFSAKLSDSRYNLDRYFISVNNVPVNGVNGSSIKQLAKKVHSIKQEIKLAAGKNVIQISCMNAKAVESLKKTIYIDYQPAAKITPVIHFVGIGVNRYKDTVHNLDFADKDIMDLAILFKQRYPNAVIDTLLNESVTLSNIAGLKKKLQQTSVDDIVVLSFSGHGVIDKNQNYFLATYDLNFQNPSNGISYELLQGLLEDIPARKKLMMIDACQSGEIDRDEPVATVLNVTDSTDKTIGTRGGILLKKNQPASSKSLLEIMNELFADVTRSSGAIIISASGAKQSALEAARWDNGAFTYCVKKAFSLYAADSNGDGISVGELRNYVEREVFQITNGLQRPTTRKDNIEFDWLIW